MQGTVKKQVYARAFWATMAVAVFALIFLALELGRPACGRLIPFAHAATCPVGSTAVFSDTIGLQSGGAFTMTLDANDDPAADFTVSVNHNDVNDVIPVLNNTSTWTAAQTFEDGSLVLNDEGDDHTRALRLEDTARTEGLWLPEYSVQVSDISLIFNTVLVNTDLQFSVTSGVRYAVDGFLYLDAPIANDIKFRVNDECGTGNIAASRFFFEFYDDPTGIVETAQLNPDTDTPMTFATVEPEYAKITGFIDSVTGNCTYRLQVAQVTSGAGPTKLREGSWWRVTRLND